MQEAGTSPDPSAQGGEWDYMPLGSFREDKVEATAAAQAPGAVSEIIHGDTGLFIVKTLDVRPGRVIPFEEAQEDIDQKVRDAQYDKLTAEHFRRLRAKATIVEADRFQELILRRALELYLAPKPR